MQLSRERAMQLYVLLFIDLWAKDETRGKTVVGCKACCAYVVDWSKSRDSERFYANTGAARWHRRCRPKPGW